MKIVDNYEAKIWLGLREGYTDNYFTVAEVSEEIRNYCTEVGQCVTISPTHFAYVNGEEPGLIIGFINYARYPASEAEIRNRARDLATRLMKKFKQYRVTITFYPAYPSGSVMLENEDFIKSVEDCKFYDEAQGRYKCCSDKSTTGRCLGICEHFEKIKLC
jgi:hypothetical protein